MITIDPEITNYLHLNLVFTPISEITVYRDICKHPSDPNESNWTVQKLTGYEQYMTGFIRPAELPLSTSPPMWDECLIRLFWLRDTIERAGCYQYITVRVRQRDLVTPSYRRMTTRPRL